MTTSDPNQAEPEQFDVVIVGLGPTGATLANLLGLCGVSTLVLEREQQIYALPRAVHFDGEVMRVFQTVGIADALVPTVHVNPGMRFVDADHKLLLDWPRPQVTGPDGWYRSYRFHQPDLEALLRSALNRFDHVQVRLGATVKAIDDQGEAVNVAYVTLEHEQPVAVNARFVVGCDGARSVVREQMKVAMDDLGFQERWLVVDLLLKEAMPQLGDHTIQYCDPARPATYVRCPGNRRRWEFSLQEGETDQQMNDAARIWQLLGPWVTPAQADIERSAIYTFRSVLAKKWRYGRLLLAGDAAHQTPPFMGQGLCTGVRDAANLAWKLAVCLGQANEQLLHSYQAERAPHARQFIDTAVRLGGLLNQCGSTKDLESAFRQPDGSVRMASLDPPLGEALSAADSTFSGHRFAQTRTSDGQAVDDLIGYAPVLFGDADFLSEPESMACLASASSLHQMSTANSPQLAELLASLGCKAVLVRPDRYIYGGANTAAQLQTLLSTQVVTTGVNTCGAVNSGDKRQGDSPPTESL